MAPAQWRAGDADGVRLLSTIHLLPRNGFSARNLAFPLGGVTHHKVIGPQLEQVQQAAIFLRRSPFSTAQTVSWRLLRR
jgi:hypothetical protein